jgi:hypothetical protein
MIIMMSKLKDKLLGLLPITTFKANKLAEKAAENAIHEEKRWHQHSEHTGAATAPESQDYSYLYEQHDPTVKLSKEEKKEKVLETFIGTYAADYNNIFGPIGSYNQQPVEELHSMQAAVINKYHTDPHCRSIIENWVHYTVGGGIKVFCENPKVNAVLMEFRASNNLVQKEKEYVRMFYLEGELFIAYYINPNTGAIKIRRIKPYEIKEIETHPQDMETKLAYHQEYNYSPQGTSQSYKADYWLPDCDYSYQEELELRGFNKAKSKHKLKKFPSVQHIKLGIEGELRGRVPLQPVLRHLKYYEDWLMDRIRLNHERAKVVWIKEIRGRLPESTERQRRAPKGGIMLVETENVKYRIEKPQINADDAKEDGLAILHTIGAGTSLPIHILNQRSDQQVYASIRKADTPFSQFIRGKQEFLSESFEKMYRKVIHAAVESGKLPKRVRIPEYTQEAAIEVLSHINTMVVEGADLKTIKEEAEKILKPMTNMKPVLTEEVPFALEFPEVIREDIEAQAKVFKIHKEIGIASAATLAAKAGYNWRHELVNMLGEREMFPEAETESTPSNQSKSSGSPEDKPSGGNK